MDKQTQSSVLLDWTEPGLGPGPGLRSLGLTWHFPSAVWPVWCWRQPPAEQHTPPSTWHSTPETTHTGFWPGLTGHHRFIWLWIQLWTSLDKTQVTSSLMMVALLRDLSAEVIFLPRSANTMVAVWTDPENTETFTQQRKQNLVWYFT